MVKTIDFRGGIHPEYNKHITADIPIKVLPAPKTVVIPLEQHIGSPAIPLVKKGDKIHLGQEIGKAENSICAPVHASVSGSVAAVEPRPTINGRACTSIVIENDEQETEVGTHGHPDPIQLSESEIRDRIAAAGIVGLGGAGFPTAAKLNSSLDNNIEYLIINGSECEPFLTADQRVMEEYTQEVVLGAKLLAKACRAQKIIIAVEENKPESIKKLSQAAGSNAITITRVVTKYPAGGERQLIKAILGREVPANGFPFDVGVVVQNISTAWATARACLTGKPLIERVITVSGDGVNNPGNFLVRLGTPFKDVIEAAGGLSDESGKIISGGPMMGQAQFDLDVPVEKSVTGIIVYSQKTTQQFDPMPCIKCSRCVDVCPAYLMPIRIEQYAMNAMWDEAAEYGAMDCIECGCCTYICPSKRGLYHWIKLAKFEINKAKQHQTS